jgi:hypothetical protein
LPRSAGPPPPWPRAPSGAARAGRPAAQLWHQYPVSPHVGRGPSSAGRSRLPGPRSSPPAPPAWSPARPAAPSAPPVAPPILWWSSLRLDAARSSRPPRGDGSTVATGRGAVNRRCGRLPPSAPRRSVARRSAFDRSSRWANTAVMPTRAPGVETVTDRGLRAAVRRGKTDPPSESVPRERPDRHLYRASPTPNVAACYPRAVAQQHGKAR